MTTENTSENTTQTAVAENKGEAVKTYTEEAYMKMLSERDQYKSELRKLKTDNSVTDLQKQMEELLLEKSKLHEQLKAEQEQRTQLEEKQKEGKLSAALSTALEAAGARSSSTVLKLIDKSSIQFDANGEVITDTVVAAIQSLQQSDPILFGDIKDPKSSPTGQTLPGVNFSGIDAKRAGEGSTQNAYLTELKSAKNINEIKAIALKYGIQT